MNFHSSHKTRALMSFFVGFLFWSWGGNYGWRTLQVQQAASQPRPKFKADAAKTSLKTAPSSEDKLLFTRRVADAVKDPRQLTKSDVADAKALWGDDAKMLQILKDSAQ